MINHVTCHDMEVFILTAHALLESGVRQCSENFISFDQNSISAQSLGNEVQKILCYQNIH